jgi:hypothetical protein
VAIPRPRRGLAGQDRVVAPSEQLSLGRLHVLAELDQAESELAAAAALLLPGRHPELGLLPPSVGFLQGGGESQHLAPVERRDTAPDGQDGVILWLGQVELGCPRKSPHERRMTAASVAQPELTGGLGQRELEAVRRQLQARDQAAEEPGRARTEYSAKAYTYSS